MTVAFEPIRSVPLSCSLRVSSRSAGTGGIMPPSYQVHLTAGIEPRAGKCRRVTDAVGALISVWFALTGSTEVGAVSPSAQ